MRPKLAFCLLLSASPVLAGELTGRLTLNDRPAAGVTVHAYPFETTEEEMRRLARREPPLSPLATAVSDAKGEYRLVLETPTGAPGRLVWVNAAGGRGAAARYVPGVFDSSESDELDEVALGPAARVFGRVVDTAGAPVAGADVFLGGVSYPMRTTRTGPDGAFAFDVGAEAGNDIHVAKAGFAGARAADVRAGAPRTIVLARPAGLSGTVLSRDGAAPAVGALVRAEARGGIPAYAETDGEGRFSLPDVAPGRVSLSVRAGESGTGNLASVPVPFSSDKPLAVRLLPVPTFAGRVFDATARRPLAGARVRVFVRGGRGPVLRTDASGRFSAPGSGAVTTVIVSASRYVTVSRAVLPGAATLDVFLRVGATVTGLVSDEERKPVAGARLRALRTAADAAAERELPAARTREDGTFTLRRVPAGDGLKIAASSPDFESASTGDLDLKSSEVRTGVALTLRRGLAIAGIVTDAAGAPLADVQVLANVSYQSGPTRVPVVPGAQPRAVTGKDGRFRLGGLAPGEYSVFFMRNGFERVQRTPVRVAAERGSEPLTVVLGPEGVIRGRVVGRLGGRGAAAQAFARASVPPAAGERQNVTPGRVGPDGTFEIVGLKQGAAYDVSLMGSFEGEETRKGIVAPADGVEIVARGYGRLTGRVLDAAGHPVPEFRVSLALDRAERARAPIPGISRDFSDESGAFELDDAPAGSLTVSASARGRREAFVSGVVVEEGRTKDGVEIRLGRGATLKGRVVEARSGRPVPEARIEADGVEATSDADGLFEAEGVAPGKVHVTAQHADYAAARETVSVGEDGGSVELKLSTGGSASAVVALTTGEPIAGARANVSLAGGGAYQSAVAGADGRVRFRHLLPGRYTLRASDRGRTSKEVEFALGEDESRDDLHAVVGGGATLRVSVTGLAPEERPFLTVGAWGRFLRAADAGPDGRFEFKDVPAETSVPIYASVNQTGSADAAGSRGVQKNVQTPEVGGSIDVELAFEPGLTLTVRVTRGGAAVDRAWVSATTEGQGGGTSARTDASGSCRLGGLKAGKVRVTAWLTALSASAVKTLELSGDQTIDVEIPAGRIAGRVVAAGSGEPLASVSVASGAAGATEGETSVAGFTDSTGRFVLENVPPGPRRLTASLKGWVSDPKTVDAADAGEIVIEMRRGEGLEVRARDGLTGTPLTRVYIRLVDGAGRTAATSVLTLDGQGSGEAPAVPEGVYSVLLGGSGYAPVRIDGAAVPGPAVAAALTPGGTLTVEVMAERLARGALTCRFTGPGGQPLVWNVYDGSGDLRLSVPSAQLRNFPPVSSTLTCPGSAPVPFAVPEGGTARIAVK
jgi:protocatechuate 3,4-dioxygenase beta subunit